MTCDVVVGAFSSGTGRRAGNIPPPLRAPFWLFVGCYSSADEAVVRQHFAWCREAEVDVIVVSWWGIQGGDGQKVSWESGEGGRRIYGTVKALKAVAIAA